MKKILTILFISVFTISYTQINYEIVEGEPTKGKTRGSGFIGIDDNGYIYTQSYKYTYALVTYIVRPFIKVFNASTGEMHAEFPLEKIPGLKARGLKYKDIDFIDDKATIICTDKVTQKPMRFYGVHIDQNGELVGERFEIGVSPECKGLFRQGNYSPRGINYQKMSDGTFTFVSDISCSSDELKTFQVIDLDESLEVKNSFTFSLEYDRVSNLSMAESGDFLYLKATTSVKEKVEGKLLKRWIVTPRLFKIRLKDGSIEEIPFQDNVVEPLSIGDFRIKPVSQGILLSGQILKDKKFSGIFTAIYEEATNQVVDVNVQDFDAEFVTQYWSERQKRKTEKRKNRKGETLDDEDFSGDFLLMEAYETADNGLISVYQEFDLRIVTRTTTDANGVTTTTTDYYYYYKDVIIVKTDENGKIAYTKLFPFYQLTVNYDPGIGYTSMRDGNDIYFLHGTSNVMEEMIEEGKKSNRKTRFRDRAIRYGSITRLTESGDVSTEQVLDLSELRISIDPSVVGSDEDNKQFVILSPVMKMFNRKKTRMIRIEIK
ncbi:MAG: hypothetical protein R3277_13590 [Brumimicrobium sp.]|nr:hypothetical protein [Brumimicrobium sp.]